MSLKIIESDEALEDVISIANYLAEYASLKTSDRFVEAAERGYGQLAAMPGMGSLRNYNNLALVGMRMWPVPRFINYLIFYRAMEEELEILRVLHGAQDLKAIFAPEDP